MLVTEAGTVTDASFLQPENAEPPIVCNVPGSDTLARLLQPENTDDGSAVTLLPIVAL
jgi:hypothetical protein